MKLVSSLLKGNFLIPPKRKEKNINRFSPLVVELEDSFREFEQHQTNEKPNSDTTLVENNENVEGAHIGSPNIEIEPSISPSN